jgi:chemotaxis signal transduction protein
MEKTPNEEDLKGLEEEIESAINRLFVEKSEDFIQSDFKETSALPSSEELEKDLDIGALLQPPPKSLPSSEELEKDLDIGTLLQPPPKSLPSSEELEKDLDMGTLLQPPPKSPPSLESVDELEAQILALEWEITDETIRKTEEQVRRLRGIFNDDHDIGSLLRLMEKALDQMINNDETVGPALTRFLLDSKEMLKLLIRGDGEGDAKLYRKLACEGVEAKFSLIEGMKNPTAASLPPSEIEDQPRNVLSVDGGGKVEEMLTKLNLLTERIDRTLAKIEEDLSQPRGLVQEPHPVIEIRSLPVHVTVFRIDGKLFGVESDKVFKLFRVPETFEERHLHQERIRLKGIEVRLIDLKKILALPKGEAREETKILLVRDDDEYKGLVIGQVVKKLSTHVEVEEGTGGYYTGMVHWTYQERPVAVPLLDLRKM